jgi:hypothetical protein
VSDERELRLFRALINSNLSRMVERAGRVTLGRGGVYREALVRQAIAMAWHRRDTFDPTMGAWVTWFEDLLIEARKALSPVVEPEELFRYLAGDDKPKAVSPRRRGPEFGTAGTPLNLNALPRGSKDCPPCWRCRYFDGWLPADEDAVDASSSAALEPEIAESCLRLDRNKVRVAKWVRGMGWENLEEDDE